MSEQRLSLLIAGGGILCLLIQLFVSLTDNPAKTAQLASQEIAYKSMQIGVDKRASRLSARFGDYLAKSEVGRMQSELELAVQVDPSIVEVGVVDIDKDRTVLASSDPTHTKKPISGPAERIVIDSANVGHVSRFEEQRDQQRVMLALPMKQQQGVVGTLYLVMTTAGLEDELGQVTMSLKRRPIPAWLTIGFGLFGLSAAVLMLVLADRKKEAESMRIQESLEQMAMGHTDVRLDPQELPHLGPIAERFNSLAEQVQLLQQEQASDNETASRMAQELKNAQIVQQTLMPDVRRINRGPLQLCGVYRSASKLSGDWWSQFPLDEHRTLLVLADVVGHGIAPAVVGAMGYGCASQLYQDHMDKLRPEKLLGQLNHAIWATTKGKYPMSCFAAILDTKENRLTFASAAHAFPLLYRPRDAQKPFIPLVASGSTIGSAADGKFEANTQAFEPGDMLICYTDGLIEAATATGDQFGDKRVRQTVAKIYQKNVEDICAGLLGEVSRFVGTAELEDDQTLVVARFGAPVPVGSYSGA